MAIRDIAKKAAHALRFYTGRLNRGENSRLILLYHGISSQDLSAINARHLPVQQFEKHLKYFIKRFNIVSLGDVPEKTITGKPTIALTFDDGFENNLHTALPLLEKYSAPATFFIPSIALENKFILPSDRVDIVRWGTKEKELEFAGKTFIKKGKHRLLEKNTGENIYSYLQRSGPAQTGTHLDEFCKRYSFEKHLAACPREAHALLDAKQVKQLSSSPFVTIGSHARTHCALNECSPAELKNELELSKCELEDCTGKRIGSIAYPYGNYNSDVTRAARDSGYDLLLAAGGINQGEDLLPRVAMISGGTFEQNMTHVHKAFERFGFR